MHDLRLSELIGALSFALDITEGQPAGHAARSCVIGMRLAAHLGLSEEERFSLFYALLLKDCGCSSIGSQVAELYGHDDQAVKSTLRAIDHRKPIAVLGHAIRNTEPGGGALARARRFAGLLRNGASSARELNTHPLRPRRGHRPHGRARRARRRRHPRDQRALGRRRHPRRHRRRGDPAPGARHGHRPGPRGRADPRRRAARARRPAVARGDLVRPVARRAILAWPRAPDFWEGLDGEGDVHAVLAPLEPGDRLIVADETRLDRVAEAFARVIDAKSPYTARHSDGVARFAVLIAERLGFDAARRPRPAPRRPPARHRQARRLQPHPRQARQARRGRVEADAPPSGVHGAHPGSGRAAARPRGGGRGAPRAPRRPRLPPRPDRGAARPGRPRARGRRRRRGAERRPPATAPASRRTPCWTSSARTRARRWTPTRSSPCARPGRPRRCSYSRRPSSRERAAPLLWASNPLRS